VLKIKQKKKHQQGFEYKKNVATFRKEKTIKDALFH
jgi:hypothetical protein